MVCPNRGVPHSLKSMVNGQSTPAIHQRSLRAFSYFANQV